MKKSFVDKKPANGMKNVYYVYAQYEQHQARVTFENQIPLVQPTGGSQIGDELREENAHHETPIRPLENEGFLFACSGDLLTNALHKYFSKDGRFRTKMNELWSEAKQAYEYNHRDLKRPDEFDRKYVDSKDEQHEKEEVYHLGEGTDTPGTAERSTIEKEIFKALQQEYTPK